METNSVNLFQPKPAIEDKSSAEKNKNYELIKSPNVGVIEPPVISKTPLGDTLCIKKQDNPRMAYKITPKTTKLDLINSLSFILISACSIAALFGFKR